MVFPSQVILSKFKLCMSIDVHFIFVHENYQKLAKNLSKIHIDGIRNVAEEVEYYSKTGETREECLLSLGVQK